MSTEESEKPTSSTAKSVAEALVEASGDTVEDVPMSEATPTKKETEDTTKDPEDVKKEDGTSEKKEKTEEDNKESSASSHLGEELPKNRFELELEFVQSLASPAYLHYLATNPSSDDHNWLDDPEFVEFLRYLLTVWTRPEYNRFLVYPQALYFLEWLLNHRREEWAQIGFRNFAHQQQFMSWQHRAERLYGRGSVKPVHVDPAAVAGDPNEQQQPQGPDAQGDQAMKEG
ncbi:of RNA polymerase II transcription subunit 31 [Seminavis robusta]|uniref:Mediator of RNA polymerase II transcription subunit 31 n=1 Tax=Seminavis robusta TaxID=568900 RepID=A0A9N8DBC4_9STRA|nr:of RNA polymerase II transcription subunit 31 [Seminavis robusta]|eukprot:Sro43_g026020.1 of RNA polymerase II transcription subunit 31 (230) ;mRNA; r:35017-35706